MGSTRKFNFKTKGVGYRNLNRLTSSTTSSTSSGVSVIDVSSTREYSSKPISGSFTNADLQKLQQENQIVQEEVDDTETKRQEEKREAQQKEEDEEHKKRIEDERRQKQEAENKKEQEEKKRKEEEKKRKEEEKKRKEEEEKKKKDEEDKPIINPVTPPSDPRRPTGPPTKTKLIDLFAQSSFAEQQQHGHSYTEDELSDSDDDNGSLGAHEVIKSFPTRMLVKYAQKTVESFQEITENVCREALLRYHAVLTLLTTMLKLEQQWLAQLSSTMMTESVHLNRLYQETTKSRKYGGVLNLCYVNSALHQQCTQLRWEIEDIRRRKQRQRCMAQPCSDISPSGSDVGEFSVFRVTKYNKFNTNSPRVFEVCMSNRDTDERNTLFIWKRTNGNTGAFEQMFQIPTICVYDISTDHKTLATTIKFIQEDKAKKGKKTKDKHKEWKVFFESVGLQNRFYYLMRSLMDSDPSAEYSPDKTSFSPTQSKILRGFPCDEWAEALHEFWVLYKKTKGWKHGSVYTNRMDNCGSELKTHPDLVSYKRLSSSRSRTHRNVVQALIVFILECGFEITGQEVGLGRSTGIYPRELLQLLPYMASVCHDTWCSQRLNANWKFGHEINVKRKTHTALLDMRLLNYAYTRRSGQVVYKLLDCITQHGYSIQLVSSSTN